jgi:hypothetical protein
LVPETNALSGLRYGRVFRIPVDTRRAAAIAFAVFEPNKACSDKNKIGRFGSRFQASSWEKSYAPYRPRKPETTVLYQVFAEQLDLMS